MEKVIKVFKNRWLRLAVSFLSPGYCVFVTWVTWLSFAYYLKPTNSSSLFALYLFINFMFACVAFYTRKSFPTMLTAAVTPLIVFALLILGFGQWYVIAPPLAVCVFIFFASANGETLKTVLGTIYLIMFVVGTLVYLTLQTFNLNINSMVAGLLSGDDSSEYDITLRSENYSLSPKGTYRLVTYVDEGSDERRSVTYFIEKTEKDEKLWFLDCYRVFGCKKILTTVYQNDVEHRWISDSELLIDGKIRNIDNIFAAKNEAAAVTMVSSTSIIKGPAIEKEENPKND